jgi:branched-chain amino acid aminotransferase
MIFWLNGGFRDDSAAIDIADRGFLLGDGLFETILLVDGVPAFLSAHLERMGAGADALGIDAALDETEIAAMLAELASRSGVAKGLASARLTLTRGAAPRGLAVKRGETRPTLLATVASYAKTETPARVIVSRHRRNELSIAARCKTLNYLDNILARQQAADAGADEALMLNGAGRIACASSANLFVLKDGVVRTPPVSEGALPGVARGVVLSCGRSAGVAIREEPVELQQAEAGALFLTNSLIGLRPAFLGEAPGDASEVLRRLQTCYGEAMADDLKQRARR